MAARKKKKQAKVVNMSGKRKTAVARATVKKSASTASQSKSCSLNSLGARRSSL